MSFLNYYQCEGTIAMMYDHTDKRQFTMSFSQMAAFTQATLPSNSFLNITQATVSYHELGRNQIIENSVGDWVFMSDSDHIYQPDLLTRLLTLQKKYDCPVLSGMYLRKYEPHIPVANNWTEDGKIVPLTDWDGTKEVIQVGMVGGGALLIKREVINKVLAKFNTGLFTLVPGYSEDFSFCYRCRELGIPVYIAPKVESHHLAPSSAVYAVRDYFKGK